MVVDHPVNTEEGGDPGAEAEQPQQPVPERDEEPVQQHQPEPTRVEESEQPPQPELDKSAESKQQQYQNKAPLDPLEQSLLNIVDEE